MELEKETRIKRDVQVTSEYGLSFLPKSQNSRFLIAASVLTVYVRKFEQFPITNARELQDSEI